ncbi:TPA: hypothetical protein F8S00_16495, partial [Legionella pneumophila]|nr:hypothetical protein [Legionella pneumophila]
MSVFLYQLPCENLHKCQREALSSIQLHYSLHPNERNTLIQLPTGTGKSALIATIPFNLSKSKVLVITPNLNISEQIE